MTWSNRAFSSFPCGPQGPFVAKQQLLDLTSGFKVDRKHYSFHEFLRLWLRLPHGKTAQVIPVGTQWTVHPGRNISVKGISCFTVRPRFSVPSVGINRVRLPLSESDTPFYLYFLAWKATRRFLVKVEKIFVGKKEKENHSRCKWLPVDRIFSQIKQNVV